MRKGSSSFIFLFLTVLILRVDLNASENLDAKNYIELNGEKSIETLKDTDPDSILFSLAPKGNAAAVNLKKIGGWMNLIAIEIDGDRTTSFCELRSEEINFDSSINSPLIGTSEKNKPFFKPKFIFLSGLYQYFTVAFEQSSMEGTTNDKSAPSNERLILNCLISSNFNQGEIKFNFPSYENFKKAFQKENLELSISVKH